MYLQHFRLRNYPFTLTPNTQFFFDAGDHHDALNVLRVALQSGEGFIKVVGEVGTGKTILCRKLLNELEKKFATIYVPNPFLTPTGLILAVAEELGLGDLSSIDRHALLKKITYRLVELHRAGTRVVLLVDEAQSLPDASIETLRLLTNLETETQKLLQVVLFGQPELDQRLKQPLLRPLRQRISFAARLAPMNRSRMRAYVLHRLAMAGYAGDALFTSVALNELYRASSGVPRVVNILCHKAMMAAYGRGERQIGRKHVQRAVADSRSLVTVRPLSRLLSGIWS